MSGGAGARDWDGVIVQNGEPVGGIQVPDPKMAFVEDFNREYAPLGLRVHVTEAPNAPSTTSPWGASRPSADSS